MASLDWRAAISGQFGAALKTLELAIEACPNDLWVRGDPQRSFWYTAFHALFWTDLYASGALEGFEPGAPFTLDELHPDGVLPERAYTKQEILDYRLRVGERSAAALARLSDDSAGRRSGFSWLEMSVLEAWIYNVRHLQHHAAQLQRLLREADVEPPRWVKTSRL